MLTAPEPWLLFCGLQIYVHVTACLHARPPIHGSAELLTCQRESHLIANPHEEFTLISAMFFLSILGCCLLLRRWRRAVISAAFFTRQQPSQRPPSLGFFVHSFLPFTKKKGIANLCWVDSLSDSNQGFMFRVSRVWGCISVDCRRQCKGSSLTLRSCGLLQLHLCWLSRLLPQASPVAAHCPCCGFLLLVVCLVSCLCDCSLTCLSPKKSAQLSV